MEERRFTMRMDKELYDQIEELAAEHNRSVAKEIQFAVSNYIIQVRSNRLTSLADDYQGEERELMLETAAKIKETSDRMMKMLR